jgi:hypothetical protein
MNPSPSAAAPDAGIAVTGLLRKSRPRRGSAPEQMDASMSLSAPNMLRRLFPRARSAGRVRFCRPARGDKVANARPRQPRRDVDGEVLIIVITLVDLAGAAVRLLASGFYAAREGPADRRPHANHVRPYRLDFRLP